MRNETPYASPHPKQWIYRSALLVCSGYNACHDSLEMSYIFSRGVTLVRAEGQSNTGDPSPHAARNLQRLLTARSPAGRVPRGRRIAR